MSIRQIYNYTLVETTTPLELPHERRLTSLLKVTNRSARIMICFHCSRTLASWLQHLSQERKRTRSVRDRNRSWPAPLQREHLQNGRDTRQKARDSHPQLLFPLMWT